MGIVGPYDPVNLVGIVPCKLFLNGIFLSGNEEILEVYGQFNEMWNGVLHPTNIYVTQLLDHAFDASINLNKWEDALKYGESTVKAYR